MLRADVYLGHSECITFSASVTCVDDVYYVSACVTSVNDVHCVSACVTCVDDVYYVSACVTCFDDVYYVSACVSTDTSPTVVVLKRHVGSGQGECRAVHVRHTSSALRA